MNRKWWPAFMAGELMPAPEESPSGWIREALGDRWLIAEAAEERTPVEPGESDPLRREIAPGEVIDFLYCDDLGTIRVRIVEDKKWELLDPVPAGANFFNVAFDFENCGDTVEAAMSFFLDEAAECGEEYEIACAAWSGELPHRFEIGPDGPQFVALTEIPALGEPAERMPRAQGELI